MTATRGRITSAQLEAARRSDVGFFDRLSALFASEPTLASALLRAAPGSQVANDLAIEKRFAQSMGSWRWAPRGDQELLEAYSTNPYLFGPVSMVAEAFALVEPMLYRAKPGKTGSTPRELLAAIPHSMQRNDGLVAMKDAGLLEPVLQDPLLDLLEHPMAGVTGYEFWELYGVYATILGETLLVKEGRPSPGQGVPKWLSMAPPTRIQRRPDPDNLFFEVRTHKGVDRVGLLEAIWSRRINPADPWTGVGVGAGRSLLDELAMDEAMGQTGRARFKNNATPELILGLLGSPGATGGAGAPNEKQIKQFVDDFVAKHQGAENAGRMHAISGGFQAQQLGHTLVESQWVEGRKHNRDTAMQTLRTPPEKLGVLENANRSTIDAAETMFQTGAIVPLANRRAASLQAHLVPDFGAGYVIGFRNPVPADRDYKKAVFVALSSAFKVNEIRALGGEPPLPPAEGDVLFTPAKITETAQVSPIDDTTSTSGNANVPVADKPKNTDPNNPAKPPKKA